LIGEEGFDPALVMAGSVTQSSKWAISSCFVTGGRLRRSIREPIVLTSKRKFAIEPLVIGRVGTHKGNQRGQMLLPLSSQSRWFPETGSPHSPPEGELLPQTAHDRSSSWDEHFYTCHMFLEPCVVSSALQHHQCDDRGTFL
jgi:hypothetical protein